MEKYKQVELVSGIIHGAKRATVISIKDARRVIGTATASDLIDRTDGIQMEQTFSL